MVRGDPAREVYRLATQAFGNDDVFVIAMVTDDVFTPDNLEALRRISHGVLHLPGVRRAESLVDILSYRFDPAEDWIDVARFIGDEIPRDPAELADLRARALADPIYPKLVVSRDGSAAAINISFQEISDREFVDRGLDDEDPRDRRGRGHADPLVPLRGPPAREGAHRRDHGARPAAADPAGGGGRRGGRVPHDRLACAGCCCRSSPA